MRPLEVRQPSGEAELEFLYVAPAGIGNGYGTALWIDATQEARAAGPDPTARAFAPVR